MSVLHSLTVFVAYVYVHSYLVIGMLLCLVGLKECGLGTQSLGLDWPLSEVGTRLEQHMCSIPHRLIIRACLPGLETENTHTHTFENRCILKTDLIVLIPIFNTMYKGKKTRQKNTCELNITNWYYS